jgi:23S rRNA (cytidine2498-2'-O)-methyltransferase
VVQCLAHIQDALEAAGIRAEVACKQLYTDREEVTCHIRVLR